MEGLLGQLGIDWKLLLSQVFNFAILLLVLRQFVYKPLLAVIKKRNAIIKEGLDKAAEADVRLHEVDSIAKGKLQKADNAALAMIKETENRAKTLEASLKLKAEQRQAELMAQITAAGERQKEEARQNVLKGASELIKKFIVKTVELKPELIDEALIEKAADFVKHEI